ncbi:uncharacterized protein LOC110943059 [Helianthus annuus]|uniref:uncharacterized protein LOC110943059 n=1 Tax=Helianthus annuus TaxID=4232 RepID=UPI000B90401B|nr:uncharacterized protein LOC110943059 [Helianthus annuus]
MESQDFYNMFAGSGGVTQSPASIMQNVNLENELGTMQKPPKLMSLDEYSGWSGRFKNWVQANHLECWIKIERKYVPPVDGLNMLKTIASLTDAEQVEFKAEKKMVSILQQVIKEDILVLLQHDDSAQSIWQALEQKFKGSASMIKSKKALIKKEFDIFTGIKGESTKQLIERYCHLVVEMRSSDFVNYSLSMFIEKIEAHELELVKIKKMNSANMPQDVSLYYKNSPATSNVQSPKIQTGFSADNTSTAASNVYQSNQSTPFANFEPNVKVSEQNSPQSSTGSNQQTFVSDVQCNIAVNIKNGNEITENAAKQHIALLASVLEAYEGKDNQAMMAEVVEITETVAESKVIDEVVTENIGEVVSESVVESGSEVVEEVVTEMVDEVSKVVVEEVVEVVDQMIPEIVEKVSTDSSAKAEESVIEVLNFQSRQEEFVYTMKSILPPNVFDSFADYFEEPRTGTCPRFEAEKEEVEEVIDVSKEMNGEALKEIADKALMSKLQEIDTDFQESVDKMSVLGEEIGVLEVKVVKSSELESIQVVKTVIDQVLDDESENSEKANSVKSVYDSEEDGNFLDAQKLKVETVTSTFVEYDKRVCYRCNEIGHMAKQCQKVFEKPKVEKPKVQNKSISKQMVHKSRPKSPVVEKGKQKMISPIRILKRGETLKSEDKPKSIFEIGESSKSHKTSKFYPKAKVFENQSWIVKSKPPVEIKKMESVLKNESNLVKDDVVEFESKLDKFLSEFPTLNNKVKQDVKEKEASNGLPKSVLSRWIMDSGASRHMTGSLALLYDVKAINESLPTAVPFTKSECLVLKPGFKVPDELVLWRAPRVNDFYILDMSAATPTTPQKQCFVTKSKATEKETVMWHRKMGHIHVRKMNFLVHNDLVEGVNVKNFHLSDDCIACKKGKQVRKSHPQKMLNTIGLPLERLHMDLFGPVNVKSISGDSYCLVVTDDYSRFSWVACLERKDEIFETLMILFKKMETASANVLFDPIHNSCIDLDVEKSPLLSEFSSILDYMNRIPVKKAMTD